LKKIQKKKPALSNRPYQPITETAAAATMMIGILVYIDFALRMD
jgi:hypothetical protein